jgi:hypothetical protein
MWYLYGYAIGTRAERSTLCLSTRRSPVPPTFY